MTRPQLDRRTAGVKGMLASLLVVGLFGLSACGSDSASSDGGGTASESDGMTFGLFTSGLTSYEAAIVTAAEEFVEEHGGSLETFNANFDPTTQAQQCQDAIATGKFTAFVFVPVSGAALVPCVEEADAAGVLVTSIDTPLGPSYTSTEIQLPGISAQVIQPITEDGAAAAELIVEACGDADPCQVGYLLGEPSFAYSSEREKTVREVLEDHPNIEIVATGTGGLSTPDVAYGATQDMIVANPDLNLIVTDDDIGATGVERALTEAGLVDQIQIIGGGGAKEGLQAVEDGRMFGTVYYMPATATKTAMDLLLQIHNGETPDNVNVFVTDLTPTGSIAVNADNVDQFTAESSASQ
jgi:ribose transport system substrate-binding protein